jgi:hypothetical protein
MKDSDVDRESIIGEECHIVARKSYGPRGVSTLSASQRDSLDNLILLCSNHHKLIDDQPDRYTVDELQKIKRQHETWVENRLSNNHLAPNTLLFVYRMDRGTYLCNSAITSHAWYLQNDQLETDEEAEVIGDFAQDVEDYANLWSDINSKDRISAQLVFDKHIIELKQRGFLVYAASRRERFRTTDVDKPFFFDVAYIIVLRTTNPLVRRKDAQIEDLMVQQGQGASDYTAFVQLSGTLTVRLDLFE